MGYCTWADINEAMKEVLKDWTVEQMVYPE